MEFFSFLQLMPLYWKMIASFWCPRVVEKVYATNFLLSFVKAQSPLSFHPSFPSFMIRWPNLWSLVYLPHICPEMILQGNSPNLKSTHFQFKLLNELQLFINRVKQTFSKLYSNPPGFTLLYVTPGNIFQLNNFFHFKFVNLEKCVFRKD